ncbi:MAG: hypothetical protein ABR509_00510 [Candidatus Limnocylindria bacterium]
MPKRKQDDRSRGDARRPYSDIGGPEGRHAQTHDVRRERATNPRGRDTEPDPFAEDLAPLDRPDAVGGHADESVSAADDKRLVSQLDGLDAEQLARLTILEERARLEQGGTYFDLNAPERGPFRALGGQEAGRANRYVAKRDTDYELWNRLVGGDEEPRIERPTS